jgi:tetratricopeptide (TPR) repeat protein
MPRHGLARLGIVALVLLAGSHAIADPPEAAPLETTLTLQKAMVMAKAFLRMDDAKKAVDVLEQNLARVNGNPAYLELLRDAYRAYVKELSLKNQTAAAQAYLQRLTILDPTAANDASLRPSEPPKSAPAAPRVEGPALPNFAAAQGKVISSPKVEAIQGAASATPAAMKAPVIRAIRELPGDNPSDAANQRIPVSRVAAQDAPANPAVLLSKANEEFDRRRYAEAKKYYEQLVELDGQAIEQCRDRLAYCLLDDAVEQLNRSGASLIDVRKQVVGAVAMAPHLRPTGDWLLNTIDQRGRPTVASRPPEVAADPPLNLQHYGKNPQGWHVTETTNFFIYHNQNRELVERVALIAERTRLTMARKWFGQGSEPWTPKCELVIHASAADYSRLTKVPATSPGHTCIKREPGTLRVIGRRIDVHTETVGMLEAVLPHETTHVVLAGNFGVVEVPRWADEGMAVLTEPLEKIEQHRRNLAKSRKEGLLVPIRDLMQLQDYPQAKQITAFYAQSVMLVEFLAAQRGPQAFTEFLREGLKDGYEPALRKHYGWSFADLQTNWDQHTSGRQTVAAGR